MRNLTRRLRRLAHFGVINQIKVERGCVDCGYRGNPAALHFDHRDPMDKQFKIANNMERSLQSLLAEIAKCEVRCANCHSIRSQREGHHHHRRPTK